MTRPHPDRWTGQTLFSNADGNEARRTTVVAPQDHRIQVPNVSAHFCRLWVAKLLLDSTASVILITKKKEAVIHPIHSRLVEVLNSEYVTME